MAEASENGLDMGRENTGNKNKRVQGRAFCGRELRRENILRLEKGQKTKKELSVEAEWEGGTRTWQQGSGNRLWGIDDTVWRRVDSGSRSTLRCAGLCLP